MVDTVKLLFGEDQYVLKEGFEFAYSKSESGKQRFIRKPSRNELRAGLYLPSITLIRRPMPFGGTSAELAVEFSAPKLLFGNNFAELRDSDFDAVVDRLEQRLAYMGVAVSRAQLIDAKVTGWHPSKNIVLPALGCQSVISALAKVERSRFYDTQKTDFIDGEVLHFHSNSKDVAFYDKLADLRKAKISDKRALESDNRIQTAILDHASGISVLRFEVRLNGIKAIQRNYSELQARTPTLSWLFNGERSRQILLNDWYKVAEKLDYLAMDTIRPLELLQNYLSANKTRAAPQRTLAEVAVLLIANQAGEPALRQTLDAHFGKHAWARYKPSKIALPANRHRLVLKTQETLERFEPLSTDALLKSA